MLKHCTRLPSHAHHTCSRRQAIPLSASLHPEPKDLYNAFITRFTEDEVKRSSKTGPLAHLRISVKDNFAVKSTRRIDNQGVSEPHHAESGPTTCASKSLAKYHSPYDATVVQILRESGARIVGKTNMDEFGMGSYGAHSQFGPVLNPCDTSRVAGGSSSGAAASVSGGLCNIAIGSDTGGSIRLPASYTGTFGYKPSYGMISRYGLVAYASSLDTVGIIGHTVQDIRTIFDRLSVYDPRDPTAVPAQSRPKVSSSAADLHMIRIGVPSECFPSELSAEATMPLRRVLKAFGTHYKARIVPVSIPSIKRALSAYYTIASAEASSNLAKYDGMQYGYRSDNKVGGAASYAQTRTEGFGQEVQKRVILGTYALTADAFNNYFLAAQALRNRLKDDMDIVFAKANPLKAQKSPHIESVDAPNVDVLMYPSAISVAPTLTSLNDGSRTNSIDSYLQDVLTVPASLAGLPAISCPFPALTASSKDGEGAKQSEELPVGVQIVGQWGDDAVVLQVAEALADMGSR